MPQCPFLQETTFLSGCFGADTVLFTINKQIPADSPPSIILTQDRLGNKLWAHALHVPYCWCAEELQTSLLQHMKMTNSYWNVYARLYFYILDEGKKCLPFFPFFFPSHYQARWCCVFSLPCLLQTKLVSAIAYSVWQFECGSEGCFFLQVSAFIWKTCFNRFWKYPLLWCQRTSFLVTEHLA